MKITNCHVYNLSEAIVGSGLPMVADYSAEKFSAECDMLEQDCDATRHHIDRALKLCRLGPPHCNFLTGILVSMNVTATQAFFLQAHRYHWWQVVSSQSKMHRLKKMTEDGTSCFAEKVDENHIKSMSELDLSDIEELVYNCPMGLETTEMVTLNYMQLRTIYAQRHNHRLKEWRDFCEFIKNNLPMAELIVGEEATDQQKGEK